MMECFNFFVAVQIILENKVIVYKGMMKHGFYVHKLPAVESFIHSASPVKVCGLVA